MTGPRETMARLARAIDRDPDRVLDAMGKQLAHHWWRGFGRGFAVGNVFGLGFMYLITR